MKDRYENFISHLKDEYSSRLGPKGTTFVKGCLLTRTFVAERRKKELQRHASCDSEYCHEASHTIPHASLRRSAVTLYATPDSAEGCKLVSVLTEVTS